MIRSLLVAAVVLASQAQATSLHPDTFAKTARLTRIDMHPGTLDTYNSGNIKVGLASVTLSLRTQIFCFRAPCPQPNANVINLPIVETRSDCGSKVIVAREDKRPVDGLMQEIIVQDNSTRFCKDLRPKTEITYTMAGYNRLEGGAFSYESKMLAETLKTPFAPRTTMRATAQIKEMKLDQSLGLSSDMRDIMSATVYLRTDSVEIDVQGLPMMCAAVIGQDCPEAPSFNVKLPILEETVDGCGIRTIRAGYTRSLHKAITIVDYSQTPCELYVKYPTHVTYSEEGLDSYLFGDALAIVRPSR